MKTNNYILLAILAVVTLLTGLGLNRFAQASPPIDTESTAPQWTIEALMTNFRAVEMVSATNGWAAGTQSRTHDAQFYQYDGSRWQLTQVVKDASIEDIDMVSATEGWAVGGRGSMGSIENSAIWYYDGLEWQLFPSPAATELSAVDMTSATSGWAVGRNVVLHYNGVAWEVISSDVSGYDIDALSENDVWVVDGAKIWHYDGTTWQEISDNGNMLAISMLSPTDGWAVGIDGEIMRYNGTTWSQVASPTDKSLYDVVMRSANDGWAVGSSYNSQTSNYESVILHYDGTSWQSVSSISSALRSISMGSATTGWTVGDDSTIVQYDGSAWQTRPDLLTPGASVSEQLEAVDMLSASDSWAVGGYFGRDGVILDYDGNKWNPVASPTDKALYDIEMLSVSSGWAVAGGYGSGSDEVIFYYDGSSWQSHTNLPDVSLYALDMLSATSGWAVGYNDAFPQSGAAILHYDGNSWNNIANSTEQALYDVHMISASSGWAVGNSGVILSYDGSSWNHVASPTEQDLYAIDMVSATEGWAVGGESYNDRTSVILHYDGNSWQSVTSPTDQELRDVAMVSATEGWAVGIYGTLLYYDGNNWQSVTSPTGRDLRAITMLDSQTGQIVGESGVILSLTKATAACYPNLPSPQLALKNIEPNNSFTRYNLTVDNRSSFPDELFAPAPHLPPCGANSNASRTWVDIYDGDDNYIYGFCGLSSADQLDDIWFAVSEGESPPSSAYITLQDRECNNTYTSNSISPTGQGVDLQITSPSIKNEGPFYPGGSIGVSAQVQNASDGNVAASVISYWISSTNDGEPLDSALIARNSVAALSAGESSEERFEDVYIPAGLAPGTYYVVFEATNTNRDATEPDESNNTTSLPFTIEPCANGTFCDVPETHTFHDEIVALYQNGLTNGCRSGVTPITYCPETLLDRAHTAAFLLKRKYGPEYDPPKATTQIFVDVPLSHGWANWINQLYEDDLTQGCRGSTPGVDLMYCPDYDTSGWDGYLKRADMATFLARLEGWDLSDPTTGVFADVTGDDYWERAVEYMWRQGYTNGMSQCENSSNEGSPLFCPNDYVHRGMAAGFMSRAFGYVSIETCASLTVNANPPEGGTITIDPSSPDCPTDSSKYKFDTNITLTANPNSGYTFSSWSGHASGSDSQTTITVGRENRTVTANFGSAVDLSVDRIEVGQVLLAENDPVTGDPVPLIAEKPTLVRVYVGISGEESIDNVTALLYIEDAQGQTHTLASQPTRIDNNPTIDDLDSTINFMPDVNLLKGNVTLWAEVDHENQIAESDEDNNTGGNVVKTFQAGQKLRIAWTRFIYTENDQRDVADINVTRRGDSLLRKIFPVGVNDVEYFWQPGYPEEMDEDFRPAKKQYIKALNKFWDRMTHEGVWVGGSPPDRLYGWVPKKGSQQGLCGTSDPLWYKGKGRVVAGMDYPPCGDRKGTDTFAHEIGHNFNSEGLYHAPSSFSDPYCYGDNNNNDYPNYPNYPLGSIGVYGFDSELNRLLSPTNHYDFMSYCKNKWISPHYYIKLAAGFAPVSHLNNMRLPIAQRNLLVSGTVYTPSLTVEFDPFYVITSTVPTDDSSGTEYCLEMHDNNNSVLESRCFDLAFLDPETDEPTNEDFFATAIPYPDATSAVVLTHLGTPIGSLNVSQNAPEVELTYPTGGEVWSGTGTYTVTWSASDLDGDQLYYALSYSTDAGNSWIPIGTDITSNQLALDVSDLPGSSTVLIRVSASDGINTTVDVSEGTITVGRKAPIVVITSPEEDIRISPGDSLLLQGSAYDLEDGLIDRSTLQWSSSKDGDLGSGSAILPTLSEGKHVITLSGTDSDQNTTTATINVEVSLKNIYLPLVIR